MYKKRVMPFEQIIINTYEIVDEGTTKIFYLQSYRQLVPTDPIPLYKNLYIDYKVTFENGVITMYSNIHEVFNVIHRIGIGYSQMNVAEINTTAPERQYFIDGNKLYFLSDDLSKCQSWYITFDSEINNIFISNKYTIILDMKFYAQGFSNIYEIKDYSKPTTVIDSQPLIKSTLPMKRSWLIDILILVYNRKAKVEDLQRFSEMVDNGTVVVNVLPCKNC